MIFNIEEFAVHDGPGIRKLVFFKGCPLRCSWCHNPEGLSFKKELMVSEATCIHCGRCKEVCSHEECSGYERCVKVCPMRLPKIVGQEYEAAELAVFLLKGVEVLIESGGGITISGREPLAQPEFLFDLIRQLKPIHIAIETSGYANKEIFQKMVSQIDLVLMDIKHTDPEMHKKYTGADNSLILENLQFLCNSDIPFYIRIPVIPGINDSLSNMEQTALMLKDARNLARVEFLPYNQTAPAKYAMLKREFSPGLEISGQPNLWPDIFKSYNIKVSVL